MEARPLSLPGSYRVQPRPSQPQFGGISDALSRLIGVIDGNRIIELTSTDVIGMCLPRTGIEAAMRPPGARVDAAREAAIREFSGLFGNMFVVGWISHLMLKMLGNKVNWYNPTGIPAKAWINAESLEAFGKLYEQTLDTSASKAEARERFVRQILDGLVSGDRSLSRVATLRGADVLEGQAKADYLTQLCKQALSGEALDKVLQDAAQKADPAERAALLTKALVGSEGGRLSEEAKAALRHSYTLKTQGAAETVVGTNRFNERAAHLAEEALKEARPDLAAKAAAEKKPLLEVLDELARKAYDKDFIAQRFRLGMDDLRSAEDAFVKRVDQKALTGGLTQTVNLLGPDGSALARDKSRATVLRELKHFLEQFVDRAGHQVDDGATGWKETILKRLFARSEKPGLLARLLPQAEDGLVAATLKSKLAYSRLPLVGAIVFSIGVAFYNNWLTQKKHGGKTFFPGEGGPQGGAKKAAGPTTAGANIPMQGTPSLRRNSGAFAQFQVNRGGFLA